MSRAQMAGCLVLLLGWLWIRQFTPPPAAPAPAAVPASAPVAERAVPAVVPVIPAPALPAPAEPVEQPKPQTASAPVPSVPVADGRVPAPATAVVPVSAPADSRLGVFRQPLALIGLPAQRPANLALFQAALLATLETGRWDLYRDFLRRGFDAAVKKTGIMGGPERLRALLEEPLFTRAMSLQEFLGVVDVPVEDSEIEWALKNVHLARRAWGDAYGMVKYLMERAVNGENPYKSYTFEEILKKGGVCADQAYFAANTAKAHGIPAAIVGGTGDRGGHAWIVYMPDDDTPAFQAIADQFFKQATARTEWKEKACRAIEVAYRRDVETSSDDYFKVSAEIGVLRQVAGFYEQCGDVKRAQLLRERADKREKSSKRKAL